MCPMHMCTLPCSWWIWFKLAEYSLPQPWQYLPRRMIMMVQRYPPPSFGGREQESGIDGFSGFRWRTVLSTIPAIGINSLNKSSRSCHSLRSPSAGGSMALQFVTTRMGSDRGEKAWIKGQRSPNSTGQAVGEYFVDWLGHPLLIMIQWGHRNLDALYSWHDRAFGTLLAGHSFWRELPSLWF